MFRQEVKVQARDYGLELQHTSCKCGSSALAAALYGAWDLGFGPGHTRSVLHMKVDNAVISVSAIVGRVARWTIVELQAFARDAALAALSFAF